MSKKLRTLSEMVYDEGPLYMKLQIYLKAWLEIYGKRNKPGDQSVVKFIKHIGELDKHNEKTK